MRRLAIAVLLAIACHSVALAENGAAQQFGTPAQRREAISACGSDARLYCRRLKEADGPIAYLACLEANRSHLSTRCVALLEQYGR
jgi:hypothetical protein